MVTRWGMIYLLPEFSLCWKEALIFQAEADTAQIEINIAWFFKNPSLTSTNVRMELYTQSVLL